MLQAHPARRLRARRDRGGEPFASDIPGREEEECFPPALRQQISTGAGDRPASAPSRSPPTSARAATGGASASSSSSPGMLGVGLDDLVQRDTTRRHRRLAWLAAASLAGMAVTSTLAVTAFQARDEAREQRREAEGLVGFMLGDLKDKLEPIGRLDALDGVGARARLLQQAGRRRELTDAALAQRSQALSLMAEVAYHARRPRRRHAPLSRGIGRHGRGGSPEPE